MGARFVTAMVKGGTGNHWAVKGGDATVVAGLRTLYEGVRPCTQRDEAACQNASDPRNYVTMRKQGAIILGIGGDNSHGAVGTFYEGAITRGFASNAADDAVHANIVAAGFAAL